MSHLSSLENSREVRGSRGTARLGRHTSRRNPGWVTLFKPIVELIRTFCHISLTILYSKFKAPQGDLNFKDYKVTYRVVSCIYESARTSQRNDYVQIYSMSLLKWRNLSGQKRVGYSWEGFLARVHTRWEYDGPLRDRNGRLRGIPSSSVTLQLSSSW